jgi:hypothetical protein
VNVGGEERAVRHAQTREGQARVAKTSERSGGQVDASKIGTRINSHVGNIVSGCAGGYCLHSLPALRRRKQSNIEQRQSGSRQFEQLICFHIRPLQLAMRKAVGRNGHFSAKLV